MPALRSLRTLVLAGTTALLLAGCATTGSRTMDQPDFSGLSRTEAQATLGELAARYERNPRDRTTIVYYAAALRAVGQPGQAVAVIEAGMAHSGADPNLQIAYAKALTSVGRLDQAMTVIDNVIRPDAPDWNALSVKGAILDQTGQHAAARAVYTQAMTVAPNQAGPVANLGLSYAMTDELGQAEAYLRRAVQMQGASSQVRQNLALVVGLQGRFDEARALFSAELAADQVEANMAYIRALLTQQNRWDLIQG